MILWDGLWRHPESEYIERALNSYVAIAEKTITYLKSIEIFFAKYEGDTNVTKHLEGCIAWNLRQKHSEDAILHPSDNRTHKGRFDKTIIEITANRRILGLDARIEL